MIELIITIALIGLLVWALTQFIPMPENFKKLIVVLAVVCVVLYILRAFGLWSGGPSLK